jgi:hypothetical protein
MSSSSNEPEKPALNGMVAYVLVTHIECGEDYIDVFAIAGVYVDIKDAVSALKKDLLDLKGWMPARDVELRDKYPYRNKIGEIMKDDAGETRLIGWGYSWCDIDDEDACLFRMYLYKTKIRHRSNKIQANSKLTGEKIRVLEAESDISYVVGQYVPENSRFDKGTNDLIYSSEEGDLSHEAEYGPWRLVRMAR